KPSLRWHIATSDYKSILRRDCTAWHSMQHHLPAGAHSLVRLNTKMPTDRIAPLPDKCLRSQARAETSPLLTSDGRFRAPHSSREAYCSARRDSYIKRPAMHLSTDRCGPQARNQTLLRVLDEILVVP